MRFTFLNPVIGTNSRDSLVGTSSGDYLIGNGGNDDLYGFGGDDLIAPGSGNNFVNAGDGNDTVTYSGLGHGVNVLINGSSGSVTGTAGHAKNDTLLYVENIVGSDHADVFRVTAGIDVNGGGGDDRIYAGYGHNAINGGSGNDTVSYEDFTTAVDVNLKAGTASDGDTLTSIENVVGTRYAETIRGNDVGNVLRGGYGDDSLFGEGGDDILIGGGGGDRLTGGKGADIFRFESTSDSPSHFYFSNGPDSRDTIFDFNRAEGDRIDLSALGVHWLGGETTGRPQARGGDPYLFPGEIAYFQDMSGTQIYINMDGDSGSEMQIHLSGFTQPLQASDFILA